MSSTVEQIKARLNIADVVSSYIKLEKAGSNYRACCPFHNEKTPSFFVSPTRESYHCFGCNKGGDMISFVQEIEGLDFLGALEVLAGRAGVEITKSDPRLKSEHDRLYGLLDVATTYYTDQLARTPAVIDYLVARGLTEETIKEFRLGYTPDEWRGLYNHLAGLGYLPEEMEKVGLVIRSTQSAGSRGESIYDRFRGRVMFPLANSAGRVVAFSGRIYDDKSHEAGGAKYINSPQTLLYDKSQVLYGYDRAKTEIRRRDFCILVEGQMDLLMAHQSELRNTVAVSGTALTDKHLNQLRRLSGNLIMAFDADAAGVEASRRAVDLAFGQGLDVKIAGLPAGSDPAELIAKDKNAWYTVIKAATNFIDFYLAALLKKKLEPRAFKLAVSREVLPYVAKINNAIDQAHFVTKIADLLNIEQGPIWVELDKARRASQSSTKEPTASAAVPDQDRRGLIISRVFSLLYWLEEKGESPIDLGVAKQELARLLGTEGMSELEKTFHPKKDRLILEAEVAYEGNKHLDQELKDLIYNLEEETLRQRLQLVMRDLKAAEQLGDYEQVNQLLKECQALSKKINTIKQI
jgi:DNA primase